LTKKVLVVDDAPFIRNLLRDMLKSAGYEVLEATNGKEALAQYNKAKPDLVTLDIMMPEMDGIETLKAIRNIDSNASVVMITSLEQKRRIEDSILSGTKGFITKPFRKAEVLGIIDKALSGTPFSYKIERIRIVFNKAMNDATMAVQEILENKVDLNIKNIVILHKSNIVKMKLGQENFVITYDIKGESEGRVVVALNFTDARELTAMMLGVEKVETIGSIEQAALNELFQIAGGKIMGIIENFTKHPTNLGSVEFHEVGISRLEHLLVPPQGVEYIAICEASMSVKSKGISVDIFLWMDADKLSSLL
jgi:two-component system chemotaxis response regulator CheY